MLGSKVNDVSKSGPKIANKADPLSSGHWRGNISVGVISFCSQNTLLQKNKYGYYKGVNDLRTTYYINNHIIWSVEFTSI